MIIDDNQKKYIGELRSTAFRPSRLHKNGKPREKYLNDKISDPASTCAANKKNENVRSCRRKTL